MTGVGICTGCRGGGTICTLGSAGVASVATTLGSAGVASAATTLGSLFGITAGSAGTMSTVGALVGGGIGAGSGGGRAVALLRIWAIWM